MKTFALQASYVIDDPDVVGRPVTIPIAADHREAAWEFYFRRSCYWECILQDDWRMITFAVFLALADYRVMVTVSE